VRVWLGTHHPASNGATVYDTDSRTLPAGQAATRVGTLGIALRRAGARLVYKKIDSTLRGNVGAESAALLVALGRRLAVVAPAFPSNGRTTRGGVQLVDGVPSHLGVAGRDPAHPMHHPTVAAALAAQSALPVRIARPGDALEGDGFVVVDAETDAELATIAARVVEQGEAVLPVGSAGLAAQLAVAWAHGAGPRARPTLSREERRPGGTGVLVVCGSANPRSTAQVAALALDPSAVEMAAVRLVADDVALLTSAGWTGATSAEVAARLGAMASAIGERARPGGLVLTGGDTARAVLVALDAHGIELADEVLPGMPAGQIIGGRLDGVAVITKAGGFGPPDALMTAVRYLREEKIA